MAASKSRTVKPAAPAPAVQAATAASAPAAAVEAPPAAVAETTGDVAIVVKGPKAGFRRAGLLFGSTPRTLSPEDIGADIEGARRLLAIVREPRLDVRLRMPDGTARPFTAEEIETLDNVVGGIPQSQLDDEHIGLIAQLTDES
jgi:hypothetical protein